MKSFNRKETSSQRILVSILFILNIASSQSQETKLSESIISIAEELASDDTDPEMVSLYIEKLYDLYETPVIINSADIDEISRLFFLSDFQVKVLADNIKSSGRIISVYEISNLPGFDRETAMMMNLFIKLDDNSEREARHADWRNTLITNVIWKPGDADSTWLGSPVRILSKYKFTADGFSGGILAEKDPGEELLSGNPPLPDLFSWHVAWNGKGFIRRIVIGDYATRFGQGTNINSSIRTGLSLHAPGYMSARNEIRPYTSTDENNFFRGAGAELAFRNLDVSLFYSKNTIDATLVSSSLSEINSVKTFYTSGLHNTSASMQKKDAVTDLTYGINLSYNLKNFRIGTTWSEDRLSLPVKPEENEPDKVFSFSGSSNYVYSLYYNSLVNRVLLYGEISVNEASRYTAVQGLTFRPSDRMTINMLYRYSEKGYFSLHGKGPGGNTSAGGSNSILGNFTFEAAKYMFISGGCEIQEFPWIKYRTSSPSYSLRRELRLRYNPSDRFLAESAYYYNLTTTDNDRMNGIPGLEELTTRSFTASFRYTLIQNLTLGTRLYFKQAEQSGSKGMLMLQEMNYRFRIIPVTLWLRYSLFKTDDWDTRLYIYENDLLYTYSIPALSGEGSRNYMMISWKIVDKAEVRFKYGILSKPVSDNVKPYTDEFRFQVRIFI
jgi:opacity protein-like surface antigen